jgi:hypothetical protein
MTPSLYTKISRLHGLDRPGCGLAAIETLRLLEAEPQPSIAVCRANRHKAPSPLPHVGALIRNGLAKLDAGYYRATEAGGEWLAKIQTLIRNA